MQPPRASTPAATSEWNEVIVGDRDRLLDIGMAAVFFACVVFGGLRLGVQLASGHPTPWWGNAAGAVLIALLHVWYRGDRGTRATVAVHGTALLATVALLVPAAYGMGSSKWWLALVGFSVVLMGTRREAVVWATLTVVLMPLTGALEQRWIVPGAVGETTFERATAGLFFVVILLGVTMAFRRVARQRARELTETAASLSRANLVKGRFLAHMSHEVRTPLHGVIAMTDMAMSGEASTDVHGQIRMAQQSARVLLALLNNILDVTRAESDALELERRPFLLHAALSEVLRPLSAQARAKNLGFEARAEPGIVERRLGDLNRLSQIVLNLVGNALKFTDEGKVTVTLHAASGASGDDDVVELEVADTGHGIPAEKLGIIFEPFSQASVEDARLQGGAGLGLAIVRELARRMGGDVSVQSRPGEGSSFRVRLRLPRDPEAESTGPEDLLSAPKAPSVPPPALAGRSLHVLVCEDNPMNQRVLMAMLKLLGHRAELVSDGLAAWERVKKERFDLLLTDIELPGMTGIELTRCIREEERAASGASLPIVGATAHAGQEERHRLLDAGLDAHLPKPFTVSDLSTVIASVMPR